jgi:hypothetical protein
VNFIGKTIEKAAIIQLNKHLDDNNLNEIYQSAYKAKHSTETALLQVQNAFVNALDTNHAVFLIMLDLSAAFDTIDHDILYHRLQHDYGIRGTALNLLKSYMSGRNFHVGIHGSISEDFNLQYGVPQGSIMGPRIFTMYSQPIAAIIRRHNIKYHIYADDIQLYYIFDPSIPGEAAVSLFKLSACVNDIYQWMSHNKLKLNESKTEFFIASSPIHTYRFENTRIIIGKTEIPPSATIKNLGVVFDHNMNMSTHVTSICRSLNFCLWNLARIRRFIDHETCCNAMRALVLSKLDYANALLCGCKSTDIARLQRIQNRAARVAFQVSRRHPTSELLYSLHWLPVGKRIIFKLMLHIYKTLNDLSPIYLSDCLTLYVPLREGLRSSLDTTRIIIPRSRRLIGDRSSFSVRGPKLWNDIPHHIRLSPSVDPFKQNLKTYLY